MYKVYYHKLVLKEDFKNLSISDQRKIVKAIRKKLSKDPEAFGKPLKKELKGYYRLRVGFYRIIYRIEKKKVVVYIIKIGLRKDLKVYLESAKRLGL
ncbi:hypothetical protein GF354_06350 [Candidatus Peregrinibacteria bacterium]|nr:hypothetical protein [Candidatus Peregrinibacteria bacterium]